MPQSIVARKGSVGPYVADLVKNIRSIMAPNTAMHLNEKTCVLEMTVSSHRSNSVRDYVNIAGPYGVTHIILVSKGKMVPRMRIGCFPQGPTLHFRVCVFVAPFTPRSRNILSVATSSNSTARELIRLFGCSCRVMHRPPSSTPRCWC